MARPTRDEKKAARAAAGKRFGAWLTQLMKQRGLGPTEVAARAHALGGTFHKGTVSHWAAGDGAPDQNNTLILARVLDADPISFLHAAGHDALIADIIAIVKAYDAAKERGEDPFEGYRGHPDDTDGDGQSAARGSTG